MEEHCHRHVHHHYHHCRKRRKPGTLRWTFDINGITITGDHLTMSNFNVGDSKTFFIDGKKAGVALDLTNLKVSTSDATVASVNGSNNADNTRYDGTITMLAEGVCSLDGEDMLADGDDVKASVAINVVAKGTMEIVINP
jgi:hypothetical protein